MKKYFNLVVVVTVVLTLTLSCKKDGYKAPVSNTVAMSGRWFNEFILDANQDGIFNEDDGDEKYYFYDDLHILTTSNTSANTSDSILVDYPDGFIFFKIKAPVNLSALSFKPDIILNINPDFVDGETIKIIDGKILKGAARTKSGAVADSIFIEFESSVDEGSYYIITGHRDSGQPEDQF